MFLTYYLSVKQKYPFILLIRYVFFHIIIITVIIMDTIAHCWFLHNSTYVHISRSAQQTFSALHNKNAANILSLLLLCLGNW